MKMVTNCNGCKITKYSESQHYFVSKEGASLGYFNSLENATDFCKNQKIKVATLAEYKMGKN